MAKRNKRVDLDVRPEGPWFRQYDYGGSEEASETSPGRGLYNGRMDKYKSVKDFIEAKRKRRRKMKRANINIILKAASQFQKLAETK